MMIWYQTVVQITIWLIYGRDDSWKKTQETDSSDYWRARWFPRFSLTLIAVNLDNQLARSVRQKGGTNQAAPAYRLDLNSQVWVSWQENPKT